MNRSRFVVVLAFLSSLGGVGAHGAAPLTLIGQDRDQTFAGVTVTDHQLAGVDSAGGVHRPSGAVKWELKGDWQEQAGLFLLSPRYSIRTLRASPWSEETPTLTSAVISLRRNEVWKTREFDGAIAVFAWLVEGKLVAVRPVPVNPKFGPSARFAAVAALELPPEWTRGSPAVLLLKDGEFVAPEPHFTHSAANSALFKIVAGIRDGMADDLQSLPQIDLRSRRGGPTLLEFAAEAGNEEAIRLVLERWAHLNPHGELAEDVMQAAAMNGRDGALGTLLAAGIDARDTDLFSAAYNNGHMSTAFRLHATGNFKRSSGRALAAALWLGDRAATQIFLRDTEPKFVREFSDWVLEAAMESASVETISALLDRGLSARHRSDLTRTPILSFAARAGRTDLVEALLTAGARIEAKDRSGITALDEALLGEHPAVVAVLSDHGAKSARSLDSAMEIAATPWDGRIFRSWETEAVPVLVEAPKSPLKRGTGLREDSMDSVLRGDHFALVTGVVEPDGSLSSPEVLYAQWKRLHKDLETVLPKHRFEPGKIDGTPVRTRLTWALQFREEPFSRN